MQRPDPDKRRQILAVAAQLFATRPFHEVKLDAVARRARIGKGTVYVYFRSKEQLYEALLDEGFGTMVGELRAELANVAGVALDGLRAVVRAMLAQARRFPHLFELMRAGQQLPCAGQLARHREALMQLVEQVVRRGVRAGELRDRCPELTAAYVPSLVRAAVLYGPSPRDDAAVADHILDLLAHGLAHGLARGVRSQRTPRTRRPVPRRTR